MRMNHHIFSAVIEKAVEIGTPATIEAATLRKTAEPEQITGAALDGPMAVDNAINLRAATIKHIHFAVAGLADVLIVPDMQADNMLARQLEYLVDAESAARSDESVLHG